MVLLQHLSVTFGALSIVGERRSGTMELLHASVRTISWAIPATYAIQLLQDIMLRGRATNLVWLAVMAAIGAGLALVAWLLLRRTMARQ